MNTAANDAAKRAKTSKNKLITKLRETIAYASQEATDTSLELCVRALDAFEASLVDENAPWPNCVPLSKSQIQGILFDEPASFGYEPREVEKPSQLRFRMLRDRVRVESGKRDLMWRFVAAFPDEDAVRFKRAEDFADQAHIGQFRDSGEPYVIHPIEVAEIILSMGMDTDAIITGLLHDTVEDNPNITSEMLAQEFSPSIAALVEGVTKLTKASFGGTQSKENQQAENVRKMFLAMAKDIRVIPIKLCDRLHNMRTLEYCRSDKRIRKARETLDIYAPLAHRLGMGQLKSELEDQSFMHLYPEAYEDIKGKVERFQVARGEFLREAMASIRAVMEENGIVGEVSGRPKHLYSIYRKMQTQNLSFDEVYDLMAIRAVTQTVGDCYNLLGLVHQIWRPLPGRIKDYISTPKPNGYKSLHTTLIGESGAPFEVQIRTEAMHKTAEYGIAAHWKYKEGRKDSNHLDFVLDWVRQLMEEKVENSTEFMQILMFDFFSEYVFVFTPEGDVIDLVSGATPIDFAYRIHSAIGNRCQGARVNGKIVPLDYKLQMGDIVEIITASTLTGPHRDWLNIVKTHQARNKIRSWFKKELKEEYIQDGRDKLVAEAKKQGYVLSKILREEQVPILFKKLSLNTLDDLYAAVGGGSVMTAQVIPRLIDEFNAADKEAEQARMLEELAERQATQRSSKRDSIDNGIVVKGESGMLVRIARCCTPLPGDPIVGYITRGRGVSVHRADCSNIQNLSDGAVRLIDVEWATSGAKSGKFSAQIKLDALERPGLMMDVSRLFMSMNINLSGINAKTDKEMISHFTLEFDVRDSEHLDHVIRQLASIRGVLGVSRVHA